MLSFRIFYVLGFMLFSMCTPYTNVSVKNDDNIKKDEVIIPMHREVAGLNGFVKSVEFYFVDDYDDSTFTDMCVIIEPVEYAHGYYNKAGFLDRIETKLTMNDSIIINQEVRFDADSLPVSMVINEGTIRQKYFYNIKGDSVFIKTNQYKTNGDLMYHELDLFWKDKIISKERVDNFINDTTVTKYNYYENSDKLENVITTYAPNNYLIELFDKQNNVIKSTRYKNGVKTYTRETTYLEFDQWSNWTRCFELSYYENSNVEIRICTKRLIEYWF